MGSTSSPAASTSTLTLPPSPGPSSLTSSRPLRHHHRSVSSDALPTPNSYVFVQPASPDEHGANRAAHAAAASTVDQRLSPGGTSPAPGRPRRIKLFGFTPADGGVAADSPEALSGAQLPTDGIVRSTAFSFGETAVAQPNGVRAQQSRSASESHIKVLDSAFAARAQGMVRKKSGELVRPSLKTGDTLKRDDKARSAPASPSCPKYVHFDTQLEHVKHFLAQQRPAAVSRSGSPVATDTEDEAPNAYPFPAMASAQGGQVKLRLPNFPTRVNHESEAYVETIEMGKDGKTLRGVVRVKNVAFEKWVAVRYTLDHWATVSEVSAEHQESMGPNSDRFGFTIKLQDLLARIEEKTMFIAVRYTAGGREIWDNNGGQNYKVEFYKATAPAAPAVANPRLKGVGASGPGVPQRQGQTWSVLNAGQASDRMADLRRELDRLVQDESEPNQAIATRQFTEGSPSALSGRYDFGASLKAFGSNGQRGTHSPNLDAFVPLNRSPPKSQASYKPLSPAPSSPQKLPPTSFSSFGVSGTPQVLNKPEPTPDFGQSSTGSTLAYSPSQGLHAYPPTSPLAGRPPSPPAESELAANLYKSYQQYLPLGNKQPAQLSPLISPAHTRYNSFPGASPLKSPPLQPTSFGPLVPPSFRAGRNADSPMISPALSPAPSPSGSPPRRNSPPLFPAGLRPTDPGLWSPASASSSAASSTVQGSEGTAETSSPASEPPSSVPESPSQGFQAGLASPGNNKADFNTFLDKYCFQTQSTTSSLGLSGPEGYGTPLAGDYLPPRRLTPTQERYNRTQAGPGVVGASCAAAYSSSSSSSGQSTPNREGPVEGVHMDGFGGFNGAFGATPPMLS